MTPSWMAAVAAPAGVGIERIDDPDGSTVVRVDGDLDLSSSLALQTILGGLARTHRLTVLDLSHTRFIDCAGLGVVLHAAATCGARSWSFTLAPDRSQSVARLIRLVGAGTALDERRPA